MCPTPLNGRNPWASNATRHWWIGGCESGSWCCTRSAAAWTGLFGYDFVPCKSKNKEIGFLLNQGFTVPCTLFSISAISAFRAQKTDPLNIFENFGSISWTPMKIDQPVQQIHTSRTLWFKILKSVVFIAFVIDLWLLILSIFRLIFLRSKLSPFGWNWSRRPGWVRR